MLLWENILLAINGLLSNKMRALLTMLGIIIGIGAVIAIITVGDSLTLSVSENMQAMGANDVYVMINSKNEEEEDSKLDIDGIKYGTISNSSTISEDDYLTNEMLSDMCGKFKEEIYALNLQHSLGSSQVTLGKKSANVNLSGVTAGYFVTNDLEFIKGHIFSQIDFEQGKNTTIVSNKLVNKLFDGDYDKAIGSEVEININGQMSKFTIVGIYEFQERYIMGMNMRERR